MKGAIKPDRYFEYHLRGTASGLLWLVRRGQRGLDGAMRLKFLLGPERGRGSEMPGWENFTLRATGIFGRRLSRE